MGGMNARTSLINSGYQNSREPLLNPSGGWMLARNPAIAFPSDGSLMISFYK
jgi:hypothetical protein